LTHEGQKLKKVLKINEISVTDLSKKISVHRNTVNSYFGSKTLKQDVKDKIKEATGIDLDDEINDIKSGYDLVIEVKRLQELVAEYQSRETWMKELIDKLSEKK